MSNAFSGHYAQSLRICERSHAAQHYRCLLLLIIPSVALITGVRACLGFELTLSRHHEFILTLSNLKSVTSGVSFARMDSRARQQRLSEYVSGW